MNAPAQRAEGGHGVVLNGRRRFLARNADGSYGPGYVSEPGGAKSVPPVYVRAAPSTSVEAQGAKIVAAIRSYVERELAWVQRRTLADSFKGSWLAGQTYERGDLVQRANSTWLCFETTSDMPGASPAWRRLT
jgi:hypothetical protein